jgi:OHS family lactose permease-like MFS transporter
VVLTLLGKHPAGMLLIMTNLKVVNTIVDQRQQLTALALVSTAQNLTTVALNPVAGAVLDASGYQAMFMLGFAAMAAAFALMALFKVKDGNGSGLFA